jgi:transcriptional regulator with XRE-family HTH domain
MDKEKRIESFRKLDALVNERDISFYKLISDLGLRRNIFSDWKSGRSMPKMDKMIKITTYFGVEPDYFLKE